MHDRLKEAQSGLQSEPPVRKSWLRIVRDICEFAAGAAKEPKEKNGEPNGKGKGK